MIPGTIAPNKKLVAELCRPTSALVYEALVLRGWPVVERLLSYAQHLAEISGSYCNLAFAASNNSPDTPLFRLGVVLVQQLGIRGET